VKTLWDIYEFHGFSKLNLVGGYAFLKIMHCFGKEYLNLKAFYQSYQKNTKFWYTVIVRLFGLSEEIAKYVVLN
jgi:hypothetical protein